MLTGRYVDSSTAGERYRAFIPDPLPPPLVLTAEVQEMEGAANRALGRLDGVRTLLPDATLFTYFYVRKEAVLSSQIEGTQSSFADLLMHEHEHAPLPVGDVEDVSNYVAAMNHGLRRLRVEQFPLSLRLIREMHGIVISSGRGSHKQPGEFRRSQNWVGGSRPGNARYVPPPPEHLKRCLGDLELFLHDKPQRTPPLLKAALAHVQFESIHPFLDGNGRLGRLLVTLLLCSEGVLQEPLLYLSLYFKQQRQAYYDHLDRVRTDGDWLGWLRFFLMGVCVTCGQALDTTMALQTRVARDVETIDGFGRRATNLRRVHDVFQRTVVGSVPTLASQLELSAPTIRSAIETLMAVGILRETTGKKRDRVYVYDPYLKILDEGIEPIA